MKHTKKLLALLLALVMVVGMMAGCAGGQKPADTTADSGKDTTADTTANNATEDTKPQETETIKWYRICWRSNPDTDKVAAAINEYIEPLIGVKVEIVDDSNYNLPMELAAGGDVDLFWSASWDNAREYISSGAVMDLAGLLDNYPTLKNSIPDNVWEATAWGEHNWYVPIYKESAVGWQLAIPKAVYDKYCPDLKSVSSLSELEPYLAAMKADGMTCPLDMCSFGAYGDAACKYLELGNNVWVDENMKAFNLWESDLMKEYLDTIYRYNQAGYIPADQYAKPDNETAYRQNLAKDGNWGFSVWVATPDGEANASLRYGTEMVLIDYTPVYVTTDSPMGSIYMLNAKTEKADACLKFLGLLYTDPVVANLACFGIEGEHYDIVDGRIQVREESDYKYSGVWSVTNVMAPDLQVGESADKKEQYASFNANAAVSPLCGFMFDQTPVEAELSAITAAASEYNELLQKGFYDPAEYLPKMLEAMNAAGMEKVVAEYQAQLDAWLAANGK